jgi:hypothetical protein
MHENRIMGKITGAVLDWAPGDHGVVPSHERINGAPN